jgi:phi13 family phage major tail protein
MPERQSLRNVHYALLLDDPATGMDRPMYKKPQRLAGAVNEKVSPTSNQEKLWADDGVFDISSMLGDIALEIELATLPIKAQAVLLGHEYKNGVMTMKDTDEPPYLAIGFMSQYRPGLFRLVWLLKGKFSLLADDYATATDAAAWRSAKLTGTFVKRDRDGMWQAVADTNEGFNGGAEGWFNSVFASDTVRDQEEDPPDDENETGEPEDET